MPKQPNSADSGDSVARVAGVKSADRLMTLFEYLAANPRQPFGAIVKDLALPNSSAHQLLATATNRGFLEFDPQTRTYQLGIRVLEIGQAYFRARDLAEIALPFMESLGAELGETVQLAKLDGLWAVHVAVVKSHQPMRLVAEIGMRSPAYVSGLGKALLSGLSDAELRSRLKAVKLDRFTPNTITDRETLLAELRRVRELGYAEDNEEYVVGSRCFAVPVCRDSGEVVAALSVSVPTPRLSDQLVGEILAKLRETAPAIQARLGTLSQL
ncbi:MAG: IclR family transcriptional regulator [Bifidobacteriaceae bacterium]|nr:IclR family transcriptional regulator [Bifidobacteriaceae bacterium]